MGFDPPWRLHLTYANYGQHVCEHEQQHEVSYMQGDNLIKIVYCSICQFRLSDSVTPSFNGRTPGFQSENEGSTPSGVTNDLVKELIEELHEPINNEERWDIASKYLGMSYMAGFADGTQAQADTPTSPGAKESTPASEAGDGSSTLPGTTIEHGCPCRDGDCYP